MSVMNVINIHLTDKCNYRCKFCFVNKTNREIPIVKLKQLIDKCYDYFKLHNIRGRINIAGGNPLCYGSLQEAIDYISSLGIEASIITNGSLLTEEFIMKNSNKLSQIGISVDSVNEATNKYLGRCGRTTLSEESIVNLSKSIKAAGISLKINTCVSAINLDENLSCLIKKIKPDRFKLLQVVPDNEFSNEHRISETQFDEYISKYAGIKKVVEYTSDMLDSYLVINSEGKLSTNNSHIVGISLDGISIDEALKHLNINYDSFYKRYGIKDI